MKCPKVNIEPENFKNMRKTEANYSNLTKNFEVYDITWVIEKFRLAMYPDRWLIKSPPFSITGVTNMSSTEWRIWLEYSKKQNDIFFNLCRCDKRLSLKTVKVNWRVSISTPNEDIPVIDRYMFCIFSPSLRYKVCLKKLKDIIGNLTSDDLTIKCKMIFFTDMLCRKHLNLDIFESSDFKGKKRLSIELLDLFINGIDCDLALKIGAKTFMVHKAIMCTRIPKLLELLEEAIKDVDCENEEMDIIYLPSLDYDSMASIVLYAYSGDLIFVLRNSDLYMYDCINILDITHLKEYFEAKCLIFRSKLENIRKIHFWHKIESFSENFNHVIDVPIITHNFSTNMKLLFLPEDKYYEDFFPISLKLPKEIESKILSVTLAVFNKGIFSEIIHLSTRNFSNIGSKHYIRRSKLKHFIEDNFLRLSVLLEITDHIWCPSIERNDVSNTTDICLTDHVDLLSTHMKMLYENSYFFNVVLGVNEDTFSVHKCILAARCSYFATILDNAKEENFDSISNVKSDAMHVFLSYLYSGVIETEDHETLKELCDLALSFKLPLLRDMCEDALGEYVSHKQFR